MSMRKAVAAVEPMPRNEALDLIDARVVEWVSIAVNKTYGDITPARIIEEIQSHMRRRQEGQRALMILEQFGLRVKPD